MTNKFLLNRSGMSPEVTCRKGLHAIESIVSRFSLASLICLCMLTVGVGNAWGAEEVVHTLLFPDENSASNSCTSYTTTWTATNDEISAKSWSIYGFVNNGWQDSWAKIRAGAKKSKGTDPAKTGTSTITTSASFSEAITKVVVTTVSCNPTNTRYLTATKLVVASNAAFTADVVEYAGPTSATDNTMTFTVSSPTAARYYKLSFSWYNNTTTAGVIEISRIDYYQEAGGCSAPAAPTISGTASYTAGETITLTAACASGADGSTTYTWYKGADWATARAASPVQASATGSSGYTFTKTAVVGDAGTYWCEASNGSGCEAHNSTGKAITVSASCATPPTVSASSNGMLSAKRTTPNII